MELIAAVLVAGPLGHFSRSRKQGGILYLVLWATILPIQTIVVYTLSDDGHDILYWIFNALILAGGLSLNHLGVQLRERRAEEASA